MDHNNSLVCKIEGEQNEYVGNKINFSCDEKGLGKVKLMQSVLVQMLNNEFDLLGEKSPMTLAVAAQVLTKGGDRALALNLKDATNYQSGTAI